MKNVFIQSPTGAICAHCRKHCAHAFSLVEQQPRRIGAMCFYFFTCEKITGAFSKAGNTRHTYKQTPEIIAPMRLCAGESMGEHGLKNVTPASCKTPAAQSGNPAFDEDLFFTGCPETIVEALFPEHEIKNNNNAKER